MSAPAPLSQRMQETVNGWRKEADDLDSAASEKYTGSEDGFNYHREDRHAMIVEAKLLRSKANELEPLVAGVAGLEARLGEALLECQRQREIAKNVPAVNWALCDVEAVLRGEAQRI